MLQELILSLFKWIVFAQQGAAIVVKRNLPAYQLESKGNAVNPDNVGN